MDQTPVGPRAPPGAGHRRPLGGLGSRNPNSIAIIELATEIDAPISRVFDLARSIDLHTNSTSKTGERAVAGVTSGLIGAGEEVTWRARHFGVWQSLTVRVDVFEPPTHFSDAMLRGAFRQMVHHHYFASSSQGTTMRDVFEFHSPFGVLGWVVDVFVLRRYLRAFLVERNRVIKSTAESDRWRRYLRTASHRLAAVGGRWIMSRRG